MYQMTDIERAEREKTKALHKAVRSLGEGRYRNLAWGWVRGFPFRRIERSHHLQRAEGIVMDPTTKHIGPYVWRVDPSEHFGGAWYYEHNMPSSYSLWKMLLQFIPNLTEATIKEWLSNPDGAIPAPLPKPKKPYVPAGAAAAE